MMNLAFHPVRLIEEVKSRPGLYTGNERLDRTEKLDLWKEVGAALFHDWAGCSKATVYGRVLQIQKKWKSLRDAYNRELRFRRMNVKRSRIVYRYFKRMSFLGGFEGTISSDEGSTTGGQEHTYTQMIEDDIEKPFKEETTDDPPPLKKLKKIKRKRRKRQRSVEIEFSQSPQPLEDPEQMEMTMIPMPEFSETENDSDRLFLLSFVPEMRRLPVNIKMWTRAQIASIMQKAVSSQYNNTQPGSSTDNVYVKRFKRDNSSD